MKRTQFTRLLAAGIATAMTAGTLAGCGQRAGHSAAEAALTEAGTYPIIQDGTLEMTAFTMSMPNVEDLATNDFTKFLEEKTGIKMSFLTGSRDDWEDKLNLMLQSGDYPDIIFGVQPNIARFGIKEGIFIPLDDYLTKENVPNYLKMMENFDINITRETDGHIYSLANINECYHCSYGRKMWVNKHYLDEMGVNVPTTTAEFLDVCKKFLQYKPDGIPVAGAAAGWFSRMQDFLTDPFVLMPEKSLTFNVRDGVALNKETQRLESVVTTEGYKNAMKYLHELYLAGAIYDGNFIQTGEQLKTLVNQPDEPVLFFTAGTISDAIDSASNNELYRHYEAMAPIAAPGQEPVAWTRPNSGINAGAFVITDKCQNPRAALRWIDFFYTHLIGDLSSQFGTDEGQDWNLNPQGLYGLNGEPALFEVLNPYSAEPQNHDWQDIGIRVAPAYFRLGQAVPDNVDPYSPEGLEQLLYNVTHDLYEPYGENGGYINLGRLAVTDAETSAVAVIGVEVEKIIEETSVAFITGKKNIDTDWNSFISSLEKAGLHTLLETYTKAYDRQQVAQ